MKKYILILAVIAIAFTSCSTQKSGCGSYTKWEAKTKWRGGN